MKNEQIESIENKSKKTNKMNNEQIKSIEFYKNNGVKIITYRCGKMNYFRKDCSLKRTEQAQDNPFLLGY